MRIIIIYIISILIFLCAFSVNAKEYHVSVLGSDSNIGSEKQPFRTIQKAADLAQAGDVIMVHKGTYRERINPPRGGNDDRSRITYRATKDEVVEIKGSEQISNWEKVKGGIWKVIIPNSFFGDYNPYTDLIFGDWFYNHDRVHHTGEVFLNNKALREVVLQDELLSDNVWCCENDGENTIIWANFQKANPNKELTEISVRNTCFYPSQQGVDYLTIDGFHFSQAATQWGAPTAEQVGMVATHWNKGWIIENNTISNSKCSGITLGKEKSTGHNVWSHESAVDGSLHYIEVTFNALRHGWNKENIGSHIVRNNTIFNCGQTAICGSMGAAFSTIENNHIYDIWTNRQYSGAEIAGVKFHAAIDTKIIGNHIHGSYKGLWLDWMTQGTHVEGNVFYDNDHQDLFVEVSHGPYLVYNNFFGSSVNLWDDSQGGAYMHNFFAGKIYLILDASRYTPYHLPHSTDIAGLSIIPGGDNRFYNNIFAPGNAELGKDCGIEIYETSKLAPLYAEGNLYLNDAKGLKEENSTVASADFDPKVLIFTEGNDVYLSFDLGTLVPTCDELITTEKLGKSKITRLPYDNVDGSDVRIDTDMFGVKRAEQPQAGPFEAISSGKHKVQLIRNNKVMK